MNYFYKNDLEIVESEANEVSGCLLILNKEMIEEIVNSNVQTFMLACMGDAVEGGFLLKDVAVKAEYRYIHGKTILNYCLPEPYLDLLDDFEDIGIIYGEDLVEMDSCSFMYDFDFDEAKWLVSQELIKRMDPI